MESVSVDRVLSVFVFANGKPKMDKWYTRDEVAIEAGYDLPADRYHRAAFLNHIQSSINWCMRSVRDEEGRILCAIRLPGEPVKYGFSVKDDALLNNLARRERRAMNALTQLKTVKLLTKNMLPTEQLRMIS